MEQNLSHQTVKKLERIAKTSGGLYVKGAGEDDNIIWQGFDRQVALQVLAEGESVIAEVQPGNSVILRGTKEKLLELIVSLGRHCIPIETLSAAA